VGGVIHHLIAVRVTEVYTRKQGKQAKQSQPQKKRRRSSYLAWPAVGGSIIIEATDS
jgi:hypothetical protein